MSLSQNPSKILTALAYDQHLNTKQVMGIIGVSNVRTVCRYAEEGKLPELHYLSPHRPAWWLGEVVDVFGEHLAPYDAAPRAFRGSDKLEQTAAPEPVRAKGGINAVTLIWERLGRKRR